VNKRPKMNKHARRKVKEAQKVCQICGTKGGRKNPLTIHHVKPVSKYPWMVNDLHNLKRLCTKCHRRVHRQD